MLKSLVLFGFCAVFLSNGQAICGVSARATDQHRISGEISGVFENDMLVMRSRSGDVKVDYSEAMRTSKMAVVNVGSVVTVVGKYQLGILKADAIMRAKPAIGNWLPDN